LKTNTDTGGKTRPAQYKAGLLRFAVLVPHRDSRRLLEARRPACFAAGLLGAWSFPAVVPLARLSRPLTPGELKALAVSLRQAALANGGGGKITAGEPAEVPCPGLNGIPGGEPRFWGPVLDLYTPGPDLYLRPPAVSGDSPPGLREEPVCSVLRPLVLCAALTPAMLPPAGVLPALPAISFRAAAAANLTLKPLSQGAAGYSFRWRIGRLYWLPPCKRSSG
jgi:hypothetical protein